ncbi:MAG TPA: hypothetical protein VHM90_00920, partial [Phycisphaerae bacterium]|nr:hypothetical protein [Phycisphaerae bacterium]
LFGLSFIPSMLHALAVFLVCRMKRRRKLAEQASARSGLMAGGATFVAAVAILLLGPDPDGWAVLVVAISIFFAAPVVLAPFVTRT